MLNLTIIPHSPLQVYQINWDSKPEDWGQSTIRLQKLYLKSRREQRPFSFYETIEELENLALNHGLVKINSKFHATAIAFSAINLFELFLIFHDKEVTEAFCNKIGNKIVVSHLKYGRCLTSVEFTNDFWESLKIRSEYDGSNVITPSSPALKIGFQSSLGNFRLSLQDYPLSISGPVFNIRRLPQKPFTLEFLISQGQISSEFAATLKRAIQNRMNIIIAGEPSSGKTTLANALILLADPSWRLIIMEDAKEIAIDLEKFPMAVNYLIPAVGDEKRYHKRSNEIARLLHRSPDYVFLGELQNKDDTQVAFEGFAAGIRGIATTHATSLDGLKTRWQNSHKLPKELIQTIDYIVFTRREIYDGIAQLKVQSVYHKKNDYLEALSYD